MIADLCACGEHGRRLACPYVILRDTPEDRERLAQAGHDEGQSCSCNETPCAIPTERQYWLDWADAILAALRRDGGG